MPYKTIELTDSKSIVKQNTTKRSQFYKGFSTLTDESNVKLYDFDLIKQDILNHFKTKKGERIMNPTFGSIIWDLLMEPLTERVREALINDVNEICNFDPRVTPTQIDLTESEQGYLLELTLVMVGTDQSSSMKLTFNQQLGLVVQ